MKEIIFYSIRSKRKYKLFSWERSDGFFNVYCQAFGALSGVYCGETLLHTKIYKKPDLQHVVNSLRLENLRFEI